jgi:hypothetical protein
MDTTLVTVTVLSMGMAAALSVIVWRLLRDERRRSEARVAALAAAARTPAIRTEPSHDLPLRGDGPARADAGPIATSPLFVDPVRTSPWGSRLAVMACLALAVTTVLLLILMATAPRRGVEAASAAPAGAAAQMANDAGLELMSLRDAHQNGTLTITGLVHNPRSAPILSRVTVTAYAFDDKGAFLASGRALLDVTTLAPGDDSPFVVTVPVGDGVARYRIGFRAEDGRVIGHVDRRQQGPIA